MDTEEAKEKAKAEKEKEKEEKPKYKSTRKFYHEDEDFYVMDAKSIGNIGRYLNHSCNPNCFVQNCFVDTHDLRFPWVSFFALSHITGKKHALKIYDQLALNTSYLCSFRGEGEYGIKYFPYS